MHRLAKLGFTQSYTYFTWRNTKHELARNTLPSLPQGPGRDYYRPNVWPNTPDILPGVAARRGLRQVYAARLVLATTLAASYGIYGHDLRADGAARRGNRATARNTSIRRSTNCGTGRLERPDSLLSRLIARLNQIRLDNPALQSDQSAALLPRRQ